MATIGIDIGAAHSVMAVCGRGAVTIVRNDISERLTPSLVGFSGGERLLGDPALTLYKSNFKNTCKNMKMLLGRVFDDSISDENQFHYPPLVSTDSGLVGYQVSYGGDQLQISATSVTAALLSGLKAVAERSLQMKVVEAVIGVPSWFSDRSCKAMLDAAAIAGIPCLRVMSEHSATALDYGMFRLAQFTADKPQRVAFVNVGYANTTAFIAEFVPHELRIIHVEADGHLGGRDMDQVLSRIIAGGLSKRLGTDVLQNAKTRMKIEDAAIKGKKILSANQDTLVSLENVFEEQDVSVTLDRGEFADCCSPLRQRLSALLRRLFEKNGGVHIQSIELVGGGTRIPWVQETIHEISTEAGLTTEGSEELVLSRTLNQDETVAKGCALQAAMLSPRFKVREFNVIDVVVHPLSISWDYSAVPKTMQLGGEAGDVAMKGSGDPTSPPPPESESKLIVASGGTYPINKWVAFEPQPQLNLSVTYAEPQKLPLTVPVLLGQYRLELPHEPRTAESRIKVEVTVDLNRICAVRAHLSEKMQLTRKVKEKRLLPPTDDTAAKSASPTGSPRQNAASDADPAAMTTPEVSPDAPEQPEAKPAAENFEWTEVEKVELETVRTPMKIKSALPAGWLSTAVVNDLYKKEMGMVEADRIAMERKEKLNELESYVYDIRDKIEHGDIGQFVDADVRPAYLQKLSEVAEWIYDFGPDAEKLEVTAKLDDIRIVGDAALAKKADSIRQAELRILEEQRLREEQIAAEQKAQAPQEKDMEDAPTMTSVSTDEQREQSTPAAAPTPEQTPAQ